MSSLYFSQAQYEKLSEKIFNSTNFAIFASLGIHGLILASFYPNFSQISPQDAQDNLRNPGEVGLIELTPLEQSRLLDFSAVAGQPSSTASTPLLDSSSLPDITNLPPVLPSIDSLSSYPYPTTPSLPALPPLPSSGQVYAPPIPSIAPQTVRPSQKLSIPSLPPLPLPPSGSLPSNPSAPNPQRPIFEDPRDNLTPDALRRAPRRASEQLRQESQGNNSTPDSPSLAEIQDQRRKRLIAEMLETSPSLTADSRNTTDEEARKNYVDWMIQVKNATPEALSFSGNYPRLACDKQVEGTAVYGILVDGNGAVSNTKLLKSAGYPILNIQALTDITSRSFSNPTGQAKPYQVSVNFKPSPAVCPLPTVTPPPEVNPNPPLNNTRVNPPASNTPSLPGLNKVTPSPSPSEQIFIDNSKPPAPQNTPAQEVVPENLITPTVEPVAPPTSKKLEPPALGVETTETPVAPPASNPQADEPPAPPTSKKSEPNLESLNPDS